jgi:hypothetical protein
MGPYQAGPPALACAWLVISWLAPCRSLHGTESISLNMADPYREQRANVLAWLIPIGPHTAAQNKPDCHICYGAYYYFSMCCMPGRD